ncbi:MAG: ABC transporter permease subunit [Nitrospirae bacterium]|nr:MAG: ABC transporter permease subunit [Nitrospirota bacterium]
MDFLCNSTLKAIELITSLDREFISIVVLSLKVSLTAVIIGTFLGLAIAVGLYQMRFQYVRGIVLLLVNTSMGLPPVVVGLFLYLLFSRSGPLGALEILYTPTAMIIAQCILATPIIAGISHAAMVGAAPEIRFTALSLGATGFQATKKVIKETRYSILAGIIAGLGRVTAEVGAVLIVGGNIAGYTRVMTTAIALEADKGDFVLAIALGIVLFCLSLVINLFLYMLQSRGKGNG